VKENKNINPIYIPTAKFPIVSVSINIAEMKVIKTPVVQKHRVFVYKEKKTERMKKQRE
jgi:hypothetical protein